MSFRDKTDINPNILVQQTQNSHLFSGNKLLPNTVKDGSGIYYSPLMDTDGKLIVVSDTTHGTAVQVMVDNVTYAPGTHQSNSVDVRTSTGNMTISGTITGGENGQNVVIRGSHDNTTFQELHNISVPLVYENPNTHFIVNFMCAMSYIQIFYTNGDLSSRTLNVKISFKN